MIHEGVIEAIARINEDKRYSQTDPEHRDAVVRALRLAKRVNRVYRNRVPILHILDNGIQQGRSLDQLLNRKMGDSEQEVSVSVGTPPWWGDYILVGYGVLKSYYPSDALTEHDKAGRRIPTQAPEKGKTHWDEGTAREKDITWTHLIFPKEDREASRMATEYGLKPASYKELQELHPGSRKEHADRITPRSSTQHLANVSRQWLESIATEAKQSLTDDDTDEDREEVAQIIADTEKARERIGRAEKTGNLSYESVVRMFTDDFNRFINPQGQMM